MRSFTQVDEQGRIFIPDNLRRELDLRPGQLVEMKIVGGSKVKKSRQLVIHQRQSTR